MFTKTRRHLDQRYTPFLCMESRISILRFFCKASELSQVSLFFINTPLTLSKETLDLYLYFKENLQLHLIKNWTALPCRAGSWAVQVDDSWFPSSPPSFYTTAQKQWVVYGYYLPALMNPTDELSDPESQYPRPFNFSIMRHPSLNEPSSGGRNETTMIHHIDESMHGFPLWAIIVLAITSATLLLLLLMSILWWMYKRPKKDIMEEKTTPPPPTTTPPPAASSWQRRSSILSAAHTAHLGETLQQMIEAPEAPEERRRRQGDQLLQRELEADHETMIRNRVND
ncbi:hypothetical protein [Absidia glauca]|uniref:Uncharacterized protein n=1 Tax=Absidia glauca TaxID=4829 RepID=A0A163KL63_ABSGL|nr:hypothetical protein [Absidia glauca]